MSENMTLPGNPRYQPRCLVHYFGYDNLYRSYVEVELATLRVLAEVGIVSARDAELLTDDVEEKCLSITTSEVDAYEREITHHDIRALVDVMKQHLPQELHRWLHIPLTSYDVIDTARALSFKQAHIRQVAPRIQQVIKIFADKAEEYAEMIQIGRTHGQHAVPITIGFWFATILARLISVAEEMDRAAENLVGKISGPVGAYNAQVAIGLPEACNAVDFETRVLSILGLKAAPISTQIVPPEYLQRYLFACLQCSGVFAQFGRDGRNLMRSEIGEISEVFESGQVGSSTMAHKRNPINFENLEGMHQRSVGEFHKVLMTTISEHQRDLTGSCVSRDFPIIVVNLCQQLETLLRQNKAKKSFLENVSVDIEMCERNFAKNSDVILAEPFYIALQMAEFPSDAHNFVNHTLVPRAKRERKSLYEIAESIAEEDPVFERVFNKINPQQRMLLNSPQNYIGSAAEKTMQIVRYAREYLMETKIA